MRKLWIMAILICSGVAIFYSCNRKGKFRIWDSGPTRVGIQPFVNIDPDEVDSVKNAVERMYDFEVVVLEPVDLPEMAYTEIRYPRYRADSLVEWLSHHVPDSVDMVLGLTNKDISITKYKDASRNEIKEPVWQYRDFGIFGLGRINGKACVVSSNRLHKGATQKMFYKRLTRISCHEVGHVLGLRHCPEKKCLMNDANETIKTVDKSTGKLCEKCWNKIH
ncbi:MAG: matrixin family metalloprotease [Crocinitomicaceae bacterium]|nr:matrixin family metalloprotease [Crocinitomicaceae bacterium]